MNQMDLPLRHTIEDMNRSFNKECQDWDNDLKTCLILRKLEVGEQQFHIPEKRPSDINF